jgi:hypothetical protein
MNKTAMNFKHKMMKQRISSLNDEVKTISERTNGLIQQTLTEAVQRNQSESSNNIESQGNDVTALQAQIKRQSDDVCERVFTFETRVTDLRNMTEQQNEVRSEIEKINNEVTDECDKLRGQLELLKNANELSSNSNSVNATAVMLDSCQTGISGGHDPSNSRVNASSVDGHVNGGPLNKGVKEAGLELSQPCSSLSIVLNKDMTYNNNCGFVKRSINNSLVLALPIFEGLLEQNSQANLNTFIEFIHIKNIPPPLHLTVANFSYHLG